MSSPSVAWPSARASISLFVPALREAWPELLILHGAELIFSQALGSMQEQALARGTEDLFAIAIFVAWQLLFASLWTCAYVALIGGAIMDLASGAESGRQERRDWWTRLARVLNQTAIETTRVWASVLRWGLAFVLPALIAYVRLFWTPLIAALDPEYDRGGEDALARSKSLTHGRFWLTAALAVSQLALPSLVSYLVQGSDDRALSNPIGVIGGELAGAAVTLALFGWSVCAFRRLTAAPPER